MTAAIVTAESSHASSYRVKFKKDEFLELVDFAQPKMMYRRGKNHFFSFDGFVMYSQECEDTDFPNQKIFDSIEFSNTVWSS